MRLGLVLVFQRIDFRFIWTLKTLRMMLGLFANVLYIAGLTIFVTKISYCEGEEGVSGLSCSKRDRLFASIATVVVSVIFVRCVF